MKFCDTEKNTVFHQIHSNHHVLHIMNRSRQVYDIQQDDKQQWCFTLYNKQQPVAVLGWSWGCCSTPDFGLATPVYYAKNKN